MTTPEILARLEVPTVHKGTSAISVLQGPSTSFLDGRFDHRKEHANR
ncbi:hypothetical protein C791_5483 [Amycolatopsis azurea DSM 43854]|uniref:Uncharacterized protein n=1 Tax=Amycolatopsis azurea DSM 43854 TaxID=1238180 RepID=M2QDU0_9PSEU|nr:hypothetical protein C791_5483 [Amycolatopsis azurea DSM 43854]